MKPQPAPCAPLQPGQLTPEWSYYLGEYEKQLYDVVTTRNYVHYDCWPNDGTFICTTCDAAVDEAEVYVFRPAGPTNDDEATR